MRAFFRFLFVIPAGFVAACVAAAFALLWPFLDTSGLASGDPFYLFDLSAGFLAQTAQVGSVALIPWALFMVATELLGLTSIMLHVASGVCGGLAFSLLTYGTRPPALSVQTAIIVAALSFALVYWIVAGRSAGRWRRRRAAEVQPAAKAGEPGPAA